MLSIFIQIASYEDPELVLTIQDAISKASGLTKLRFGVHASYVDDKDIKLKPSADINILHTVPPKNIGLGVSRRLADSFYDGEDFYLQIDAHSRFVKNWDEILVYEYYKYIGMGIDKPLLTAYPMGYRYVDSVETFDYVDFTHNIDLRFDRTMFSENLFPVQTQVINKKKGIFTPSVSGGSIFTKGKVPIVPNEVFFNGEEIVIAALAYTNGFNLVIPRYPYMYHLYYDSYKDYTPKRKLVWQEWKDEYNELQVSSNAFIKELFTNPEVAKQHLGTERSLEEFSAYTGLNFKEGTIEDPCV